MVLTLCFKVFMLPHILYRGSVFFYCFFFNTDKKKYVILIKKGPCVLSHTSIEAISVDLPVAVNNPVAASQVGFQQFHAI